MPMGLICYASWRKRWVYCSESRGWLIARRRSESSRPYLGVMSVAKAQDREKKGSQKILLGRSGAEGDSELWSILYLASPRGHLSKVIDIVGV